MQLKDKNKMSGDYILSQGYGYGFALGVGALFAVLMASITWTLNKYADDHQDSENFTTASRTVKTGLLASAVVSSWTWPATLLTSGEWAYSYGIAGPYWYGTCATIAVLMMAIIAVEIKRICPGTHTVGEIIKVRFGKTSHIVFMCYLTGANIIVSVMLLLGGSQGFNAATGMNVAAACFLLPLGVVCYTVLGGIKATFLSDWIHTIIIYVIIIVVVYVTYASGNIIGSPSKMYDLLTEMATLYPSTGYEGSYLTFKNGDIIMIGWSVGLGTFASVLGDPSYGQKAIAASPKGALAGYFLGGMCWYVVPWALGSSAGLAALALTKNPSFFTYPNQIDSDGIGKGLPVIYAMGVLLGESGAAASLCMLFMSVTSALNAELIGISSILTYDIYRAYIKPTASGKTLVNFSHGVIVVWGIVMGAVCVGFDNAGVTVGWILGMLGIILDPVGTGLIMSLYKKNMSKYTIIVGFPLGTASGIAVWIGTTYHFYGTVTQATLGNAKPCLIANFTSAFVPVFFGFILSYIKPEPFDFSTMNAGFTAADDANEKELAAMQATEEDKKSLGKAVTIGLVLTVIYFVVLFFLVPFSMYGQNYIFSKGFFIGWVVIMILWLMLAFLFIAIYPIFESRREIWGLINRVRTGQVATSGHAAMVDSDVNIESNNESDSVKKTTVITSQA